MDGMALTDLPKATQDLDRALGDLTSHGVAIIADALDGSLLADVQAGLSRIAESDRSRNWQRHYDIGSDDLINQRVWNLPSRDPVFCDLAEHPVALHFVREILGWPALLSGMSANITGKGGASMFLHCDQCYMPLPWPRPLLVNVAWCVDDFTRENGATCIVPGSHLWSERHWNGQTFDLPPDIEMIPVEAPAGSAIIMEGRMLHTNGANINGERRAGIFAAYTLPIYLPQENWWMTLNPAVRQFGSETLLTLLGFRPYGLGRFNGLDRI